MPFQSQSSVEPGCEAQGSRSPRSYPVSGRRESGPSGAADAQAPTSWGKRNSWELDLLWEESEYLCRKMESKWLRNSFFLVGHVDQVEKGAERGKPRHKQTPIRKCETPSISFIADQTDQRTSKLPRYSHVRWGELGGGFVDPLAHLPQYVPLPIVGRSLHLYQEILLIDLDKTFSSNKSPV